MVRCVVIVASSSESFASGDAGDLGGLRAHIWCWCFTFVTILFIILYVNGDYYAFFASIHIRPLRFIGEIISGTLGNRNFERKVGSCETVCLQCALPLFVSSADCCERGREEEKLFS